MPSSSSFSPFANERATRTDGGKEKEEEGKIFEHLQSGWKTQKREERGGGEGGGILLPKCFKVAGELSAQDFFGWLANKREKGPRDNISLGYCSSPIFVVVTGERC